MLMLLLHWILASLILLFVASVVPGLYLSNFATALVAVFILSLVNMLIRPLLLLLTLPINLLTLGLFSFVINAMMFALAAWLVPGFDVNNFWAALLGSLLLAILTGILTGVMPKRAGI